MLGPQDAGADPKAGSRLKIPIGPSADDGFVEMTLDACGVAMLRGTVPTLADRQAVVEQVSQLPGVARVENFLNVGPAPSSDTPRPPPQPAVPPAEPEAAGRTGIATDRPGTSAGDLGRQG